MSNILHDIPSEEVYLILFIILEILAFHSRTWCWRGTIGLELRPLILLYIVAIEVVISVSFKVNSAKEVALIPDDTDGVSSSWGVVCVAAGKD